MTLGAAALPARPSIRTALALLNEPRVAVPLLLVFALALRVPNLTESLWFDEVQYSTRLNHSTLWELTRFVAGDAAAPLYATFMFAWGWIAGESELAVRLPSLIAGLATVALTYLVARRLGGSATAWLAGLTLCLSPAHVWYSQEATPYALAMCAVLTAVFIWPRLGGSLRQPAFLIYFAALFVGALSQFWVAVFLVPLTLLAIASPAPRRRTMLTAHGGVVACLALLFVIKGLRGDLSTSERFLRPFTALEWWMLFFNWFLHGNTLAPVGPYRHTWAFLLGKPALLGMQVVCAGLLLRGLLTRRMAPMPSLSWELPLYVMVLPLAMLFTTLVGYNHLYIERYLIMALPFFAIAVARGVASVSNTALRGLVATAVVSLGVASYSILLTTSWLWTVYKVNPDWQSAVQWVQASSRTSDRVLILAAVQCDDLVFYVRKLMPGGTTDVRCVDAIGVDRLWSEIRTAAISKIVLVHNRVWKGDFDRVFARLKGDARVQLTGTAVFKAVELHTFVTGI